MILKRKFMKKQNPTLTVEDYKRMFMLCTGIQNPLVGGPFDRDSVDIHDTIKSVGLGFNCIGIIRSEPMKEGGHCSYVLNLTKLVTASLERVPDLAMPTLALYKHTLTEDRYGVDIIRQTGERIMTIADDGSFQSILYRFIDKLWHLAACKGATTPKTSSGGGDVAFCICDYYDDLSTYQETKLALTGLYRVCPVGWTGFLTMLAIRGEMNFNGERTIAH